MFKKGRQVRGLCRRGGCSRLQGLAMAWSAALASSTLAEGAVHDESEAETPRSNLAQAPNLRTLETRLFTPDLSRTEAQQMYSILYRLTKKRHMLYCSHDEKP